MRTAIGTLGLLGLLVHPSSAADIFTWRDARGVVHYSNAPASGRGEIVPPADLPSAPPESPPDATIATDHPAPALPDAERAAFSDRVSGQRRSLEQAYRAASRHLTDIERQLQTLQRARVQHANLGTNAADAVSADEQPLLAEKSAASKERDQVRADYETLAAEVTKQLGALPDWWIALR